MTTKTIFPALLLLCSLLTLSGNAQTPEQAVTQAVDKLRQLMIDPDKAGLEALAADGLSYGHSNGKIEDKKAFMDALLSGESDFKTIDLTEQTIKIVDNTALVRHKLMAETSNSGQPGQAKLAVLLIWIKQKNNWKLLARQAVKI